MSRANEGRRGVHNHPLNNLKPDPSRARKNNRSTGHEPDLLGASARGQHHRELRLGLLQTCHSDPRKPNNDQQCAHNVHQSMWSESMLKLILKGYAEPAANYQASFCQQLAPSTPSEGSDPGKPRARRRSPARVPQQGGTRLDQHLHRQRRRVSTSNRHPASRARRSSQVSRASR